ncbi:relaxin-3 [Ambystoma mexicanum]|uniref:relaxin-3 n=1 Tax=Ambystoma mexicanum TaxID=8296 RepID=UPI0037E7582C
MLKLLLVAALWVLAADTGVHAEVRSAPYGVKLCGREFIRAVIFTCGGSRWRRSGSTLTDLLEGLGGPGAADSEEGLSIDWNMAAFSNKDLADYGSLPAWRELLAGQARQSQGAGGVSVEGLGSLRPSERRGRDVVVGLSNTCCKWGCSKSEISSLC